MTAGGSTCALAVHYNWAFELVSGLAWNTIGNLFWMQPDLRVLLNCQLLSTGKISIMTYAILLALNVSIDVSGERLSNYVIGMHLVIAHFCYVQLGVSEYLAFTLLSALRQTSWSHVVPRRLEH